MGVITGPLRFIHGVLGDIHRVFGVIAGGASIYSQSCLGSSLGALGVIDGVLEVSNGGLYGVILGAAWGHLWECIGSSPHFHK